MYIPTTLNFAKFTFLFSVALVITITSNGFGQKAKSNPTTLPKASADKSAAETVLAKEFELRASVETDSEGLVSSGGFSVNKADGNADALKMAAEGIDILSRTEIPRLLRKAGFGNKINIICQNIMFARDGEITLILSTPETVTPSLEINREQLDDVIDQIFERQKQLPLPERFLISPVSVLARNTVLNLNFRISVSAAQTLFTRLQKSAQTSEKRGLRTAVELFLAEPTLPVGVYSETYGIEKHLYLDRRRAQILDYRFRKLTGENLLDFQMAYQQTYLLPKNDSPANAPENLNQKLFYAEQESEWLFSAALFYLEIVDNARREGKIVIPETKNTNGLDTIVPELFENDSEKSGEDLSGKTSEAIEDKLKRVIQKNDSIRIRLRELYAKYSFVREALSEIQKSTATQEVALVADLRKRPQAIHDIGSKQINQKYESKIRRCTETGCEQSPLSFESGGFTIVYDAAAADFKIKNYKLSLVTRLF